MSHLRKYMKSLKTHPGAPIAGALTVFGFVAGVDGDDWVLRGLMGAGIMSVFWIPVLLTVRR